MIHLISLTIGTAALWLALSGYFIPLILAFGVGSVALTVYLSHRMVVADQEGHPIQTLWRWLLFLPWLQKEIFNANLDVAKAILSPKSRVKRTVIRAKASQKSELGHVIYANSITLTPGTVTIAVEDGVLTVHALTETAAEGVLTGEMDKRCTWVEGDTAEHSSGAAS